MTASARAILAALVALAPCAAAGGARPLFLSAQAEASAITERSTFALGGTAAFGGGPLVSTVFLDGGAYGTGGDVRIRTLWALGAGAALDLGPDLSLHATAQAGAERLALRDYALGGWRYEVEPAFGGRVALLHRFPLRLRARTQPSELASVAGIALTVLGVRHGSDRLRNAEWGGLTAVLSFTLGAELSVPPPAAAAPAR